MREMPAGRLRFWLRIPVDRDHWFRSIVITQSSSSWSWFPVDRDHRFRWSWSRPAGRRRGRPL